MKKIFVVGFILLLSVGCVEKKGIVEFANLTQDHKVLTTETCEALSKSIVDSMTNDNLPVSERKALEDLHERLEYMSRQSVLINEYVYAKYIDQELLARLIKDKFNK